MAFAYNLWDLENCKKRYKVHLDRCSVTFCKTTQNFLKVGIPEEQIKYKSIVPESKM